MKLFHRVTAFLTALLFTGAALAQAYPTNNPTYIPTAALAPATFSAPADYTYAVSGISTISIRVSGTCTGLTAAPQITNDNTNWTTVQAIPVAGGALVTSLTGTGMWRIGVAGATRARLHITVLTASCTIAMAGSQSSGVAYLMNPNTTSNPTTIYDSTATFPWVISSTGIGSVKVTDGTNTMPTMDAVSRPGFHKITDGTSVAGVTAASTAPVAATPALVVAQSPNGDPCQIPTIQKVSAIINIGAATTTKIVDVSGSTSIYVCGFMGSLAGTTPSVTFKSGTNTSADCDTGAANLSGTILPTSGAIVSMTAGGATLMKTAASKQLCATTVGTGSSYQGILTYVQQ